jgi:hypothetical protein
MQDESIIRGKALEAIQSGRLPTSEPSRTFSRRGAGATCVVCGNPVRLGDPEFELEFQAGPVPEGKSLRDALERLNSKREARRYHLHHRCFAAWELERANVGPPESRQST